MTLIAAIIGLVFVFALLAKVCDQYFVESLDTISHKLKLSQDVAGATFMAVGTSAPEFFTAVLALTKVGAEDIGAGTIVGSAIFNILVIIGGSAVVAKAYLRWKPVVRDIGVYIFAIILLLITFADGQITTFETLLFVTAYAGYVILLANWKKFVPQKDTEVMQEVEKGLKKAGVDHRAQNKGFIKIWNYFSKAADKVLALFFPDLKKRPHLYLLTFTVSILFIIGLSYSLVELATFTAGELGVPPVIIALTVLAGGTSVPDLIASLIVAKQGRGDMAVSNAVGSNSFDIMLGLGLPWLFYTLFTGKNVPVGTDNLFASVILLFATVIAVFFVIAVQKWKIGRKSGYILIALYASYLTYMIILALLER